MGIKIKKLSIKNFKVYKEKEFDFKDNSLIVFDGPNGFGKTTFFDAMELIFTGKIRRYDDFKSKLIDNRETRLENPLYNNEGDGLPITLKVQFEYKGVDYFLMRQTEPFNELNNYLDFNAFKLFALANFEDIPTENNRKSDDYISEFLGLNYKDDFEFLNYIEQEDSLYLLKRNEKDKQESISYLFNTQDFEVKINKFKLIKDRLKKFDDSFLQEIDKLEEKIESIKEDIFNEEKTEFSKLFEKKEYNWDSEDIDFDITSYESILAEDAGILPKIKNLIQNKEDFLKSIYNKKLDRVLDEEMTLTRIYYYDYFRKEEEKIFLERDLSLLIDNLIEGLDDFSFTQLMDNDYDLDTKIKDEIDDDQIIASYEKKLNELKVAYERSDKASKIYARMLSSHNNLKSHLNEFHINIEENGICPLCGYDWGSKEALLEEIEEQRLELEEFDKDLNAELNNLRNKFLSNQAEELIGVLENFQEDFLFKKEYFESDFFNKDFKKLDDEIKDILKTLEIDYSKLISTSTELKDEQNKPDGFLEFLQLQKITFDEDNLMSYFEEIYSSYFDRNVESLENLSITDIDKKKLYIRYRFSLYLDESLKNKNADLEKLQNQKSKCQNSLSTVNRIVKSLQESLKSYNDQLIKDIELLFHIYSGRIVQDFYGGLGLFIVNKRDKIKFVTAPDKTYDAIFSMSNGQLSALIISFTMALNKKYSSNKLLLIDDPVQSMDDMNTAGFVEVLRNDFKDTQIFLSTHEQNLSTYVRYKFKKFNISTLRYSLNENHLQ
ncbi:AAA family ATPase [Salegentibacter maritimus]|uniref:AAA family ATPase n=1 Tax=Salegentibacter maritimus TaxID=2794347 RepID=A0ABS0TGN3_9FLAO|nr:AAA family ATPase [Salegentibacter maritimus]MBI6119148.1 AAA family ATPase [Salegentibacter maritimus]